MVIIMGQQKQAKKPEPEKKTKTRRITHKKSPVSSGLVKQMLIDPRSAETKDTNAYQEYRAWWRATVRQSHSHSHPR